MTYLNELPTELSDYSLGRLQSAPNVSYILNFGTMLIPCILYNHNTEFAE